MRYSILIPLLSLLIGTGAYSFPPHDPVNVEIYLHPLSRDTFQQNERFFTYIVVKNNSGNPVFFNVSSAVFNDQNVLLPYGNVNFVKDSTYKITPWDGEGCKGKWGYMIPAHDSIVYLQNLQKGCFYYNCTSLEYEPYNKYHMHSDFQPGKDYRVKILVELNTGEYKLFERNLHIDPKDDLSYMLVNDYYSKYVTMPRPERFKYHTQEYYQIFFDTCRYEIGKERMALALGKHIGSANGLVEFYVKNYFSLLNREVLMFLFYEFIDETIRERMRENQNKLEVYKSILKDLRKKDKELAYWIFRYVYARSCYSDKFKRCDPVLWEKYDFFDSAELLELEAIVKQ
jgi:hypothetical protein